MVHPIEPRAYGAGLLRENKIEEFNKWRADPDDPYPPLDLSEENFRGLKLSVEKDNEFIGPVFQHRGISGERQ